MADFWNTFNAEARAHKQQHELYFWQAWPNGDRRLEKDQDIYLVHLDLPESAFFGMKVLDVGCGPLPEAMAFKDCEMWGIDPLIDSYRGVGFPMTALHYVCAHAEDMPFEDDSFDAVISVNAMDHVDDFEAVAEEIARVVKPDGIIRIEFLYHEATVPEPMELDDERVARAFPMLTKLREMPRDDFYCDDCHPIGISTLWST